MSLPVIGTIDATGAEPIVHLPKWMIQQASTLFWVGQDEYILTAKGELYKRVGEGAQKTPVCVTDDETELARMPARIRSKIRSN